MVVRTALISLVILLCAGAPAAQAQQVEGIAAVVNDEPITTLDVRNRMRLIISSAGVQPDEALLAQIQEQAIRGLIEETLQLQQAAEFDLNVDEAEVNSALADAAARNGATVEDVLADLRGNGIDPETLRSQLRAEIAWQIMVSGRYRSRIAISDQQIETALERQAQAAAQEQFNLGEILVEVRGGEAGEEQAMQRVQAVYGALQQGAPFPQVAQQLSDAASAGRGGLIGWTPASALPEQVRQIAVQLQPGQISNPIRVPGGYQIIALVDRREGQVVEQLNLIQVTLPASRASALDDPRGSLERAAGNLNSCEGVRARFEGVEGVIVTELGELSANALIPQIRDALSGLEPVSSTGVLDTAAGLQLFVLCDRQLTGPGVPSREQVEQQLISQQLSLLARRWLRDLRRDATVDIR
ncbi:MAG: peptidylprolyl isomerase [Alphaproteobacteria bacterium]|nr:peptidylprolyl isomerase [Alphaproteobacteria bacterium]